MAGHKLPPLNALRAFEATARHLSVKNAADELCVTPGAVSQLLKALELHLGVKLFHRVNRGIFLTDAGQGYLPPVRNAFRQIADASGRIAVSADTSLLTVSVTPFFAAAWLVPRLKEFQDAHPDIDLQVVTSNALVDFSRDSRTSRSAMVSAATRACAAIASSRWRSSPSRPRRWLRDSVRRGRRPD